MIADHRFSLTSAVPTVEDMHTPVPDLAQLGQALAAHGFAGHDAAIHAVVESARGAGLSPVLIAVLADPTEPELARLRAFGRLALALTAERRDPDRDPGLVPDRFARAA